MFCFYCLGIIVKYNLFICIIKDFLRKQKPSLKITNCWNICGDGLYFNSEYTFLKMF